MSVQTSYSQAPATARKGQFAKNGPREVEAAHANGAPVVGNLVLLSGPTAGELESAEAAPLAALTVDVDAIAATVASAGTAQTLSGASLDGVVGDDRMNPARRISILPDSHTDWDPGFAIVKGEDVMGNYIEAQVAIATSSTNATHEFFSRVTSVYIPAQTGAGGTATIGVTADEGVYHPETVGVLVRDTAKAPLTSGDAVTDNDRVDVLKTGTIFVEVEDAVSVKGAPAFLRTATSGGDVMGQWSCIPGTGFTRQPWASFEALSDSDSIAVLKKSL